MSSGRFKPGQSGNPTGKPRGARDRAKLALEAILHGEGELITGKAIELAKGGDAQVLRMCLDRLMPSWKDRPVTFDLPEIQTTEDLPKATNALLQAVASGELTPSEASDIGKAVDAHMRAIDAAYFYQRLLRLEEPTTR